MIYLCGHIHKYKHIYKHIYGERERKREKKHVLKIFPYSFPKREANTLLPGPRDREKFFYILLYGSKEVLYWQFFSKAYQNIKCI